MNYITEYNDKTKLEISTRIKKPINDCNTVLTKYIYNQ